MPGPAYSAHQKDQDAALAVPRATVAAGVNHIDTTDFYGPHVNNKLIRQALAGDLSLRGALLLDVP